MELMYNKFRDNILSKQMVKPGDKVLVALSGGSDSVCLLSLMKKLGDEMKFSVQAMHVNHMLRGNESDGDEAFCVELCSTIGVPINTQKINVKEYAAENRMTLEEAGRSVRYNLLKDMGADKVAIAHNMDDNAETLLINLTRGAGIAGLSGISEISGNFIRPLMIFRKIEIVEYCKSNTLEFRTDSSNMDTAFFRNSVRHRLIPLMEEITGRDMIPILDRTAGMAAVDESYIDSESEKAIKECVTFKETSAEISNAKFNMLHTAVSTRVIRKTYEIVEGTLKDFEKKNTDYLIELIKRGKTGESMDLSADTFAIVQFGTTVISSRVESEIYEYNLPVTGSIYIKERDISLKAEYMTNFSGTDKKGTINIKADGTEFISVRNRIDGDRFTPAKGNGTKKLKKYFIDQKIHRMERNKVFLLVIDGKIAYIEGMDYGKGFKPQKGDRYIRVEVQ